MRKAPLTITLVSIVSIVIAAWLIVNYAPNQTNNETSDVDIAQFAWTSNWGTGPVGTLWGRSFNVTLHNQGVENITGLTVEVKMLANTSELWSQTWFDNRLNVTFELQAGEIREFQGGVMTKLDEVERTEGEITLVVAVKLDDATLDELQVP